MSEAFILDTCVLSEASKSKPHGSVIQFLQDVENLVIPVAALMEFQRGISEIAATAPVRAVKLGNWYQRVLEAGFPILDTTKVVAEIWGVLGADPRLRNLGLMDPRSKKPRYGQDLHIAAFSLAHRLPIATMNVRDFEAIDRCHPLPGIYNPMSGRWHARMLSLAADETPALSLSSKCI